MASNTTNLNLLKKDLVADANDTFNIETMLNENWDKVDQADGENVKKEAGKGLSTEDYTSEEKTKLAGIEDNANNYQHPATHNASTINTDSTHRFVTDVEKNTWNDAEQNAKDYMDSKKDLTDKLLEVANIIDDTTGESELYYFQVTDATITADIVVDVNFLIPNKTVKQILSDAVFVMTKSFAGYYRIFFENIPAQDLTIDNIIKQ